MTAPRVLQPSRAAPRGAIGVWIQLTGDDCRRSPVWLGVLVLSFLSGTTSANFNYNDVQYCLEKLRDPVQNSTAMLYTPSISTEDSCEKMSLKCYLTELMMVIEEREIHNVNTRCIDDFNAGLPESRSQDLCLQCEEYPQQNITTFLEQLGELLERLLSKG